MPQTGYTPIINYNSATASAVPAAVDLTQGEQAINVTDKKIYTKDSGGSVVQIGSGPSATDTLTNKSISLTTNTITGTGAEFDTACSDQNFVFESDIGVSVQAYDADTAKLDVDQTWTGAQRGTTTTDNDLSFDLNASNNFQCTPSAGGALTFTNITAGQSGFIKLVNGSNYAITAHANTKVTTTFLATISATGTYIISYFCDGTNVFCATAGAMA